MSLRFHEIAEADHRILNPLSDQKQALIGDLCDLEPGSRILDLCCGKAEMLATWARDHGLSGVGVDISDVFIDAAVERADELGVTDRLELVRGEAAAYAREGTETFDIVSCIGASWIGDGLSGTIDLMLPRLKPGGLLLIGEPYWIDPLPDGLTVVDIEPGQFEALPGILERVEAAGLRLIEMVLANGDDWDRYAASQWKTVDSWLLANAEDPEAAELDAWVRANRRSYLTADRRYLGWGVFVLRS